MSQKTGNNTDQQHSKDEEYYKDVPAEKLIFSKELLNQIVLYEKTVCQLKICYQNLCYKNEIFFFIFCVSEIIGIVDKAEMKPKLMRFTLRNNEDDIIQVLVWDEEIITNITSIINSGNVLT